jgi:hypothetical protein
LCDLRYNQSKEQRKEESEEGKNKGKAQKRKKGLKMHND